MSSRIREYAGDDAGFVAWLTKADAIAEARCGLSIFDLADRNWRDAYEAGSNPKDEVLDMLAEEGFEGGDE
jgi:hypothetical protein